MKVLVIRFSSIGDIILTTPVIRCLKQQHPGILLHYLVKEQFATLLEANPYIDKIHTLGDSLDAAIKTLKAEQYDHVIDLHQNARTFRVKKALGLPSSAFRKLNIKKWLLTNLKVDLMPDKSIVDRYFEAKGRLKLHNDGQGLDYFIPERYLLHADDIPMAHWGGFVACVIGGSYNTKKFPVDKWRSFCEKVPFPVVLVGGPEDRDAGGTIAAGQHVKVYNSCGKFNIHESAGLVQRAKVIVSNDTGLMHIATAFKKPVVSLWGNTSPEMGMFPYYGFNNLRSRVAPQSVMMEHKTLRCHPCSKLGYNKCPRGHFRCMNDLDVDLIVREVVRLWNRTVESNGSMGFSNA